MKKLVLSIMFVAFLGFVYADNEGTKSNASEAAPVETLCLSVLFWILIPEKH